MKFTLETILRVGCFGIFFGHGYLAAFKLEFAPWAKFMKAAGFTDKEAHVVMPLIGIKDIVLALLTATCPCELTLAWMTSWAFSTALIRPVSGGLVWGFVERAGNFCCPLALLHLLTNESASLKARRAGQPGSPYELLSIGSFDACLQVIVGFIVATWLLVLILRARPPPSPAKAAVATAKPSATYVPPHRRRPASPAKPKKSPRRTAKSPARASKSPARS